MSAVRITLLVEALRHFVSAAPPDTEWPVLEAIWSQGSPTRLASATVNHLRFALFGLEPTGDLPVAALTHVSDRRSRTVGDYYWLRADPVTVWADMARVFMTRHGFADLDPGDRDEIENCIRGVLQREGFDLHADHPERWCIPLARPLEFSFTPLDDALGMDLGDALPDHPEARHWRRILTEIQVELHNCPVNMRRRSAGRREINSVWFWGGGFLPDATISHVIDTVYADDAVSRGLGIISDCRVRPLNGIADPDLDDIGHAVLIDWHSDTATPEAALARLEDLAGRLLKRVSGRQVELAMYDGSGEGRRYGRSEGRRFWRRRRRLSSVLAANVSART